MYENLIDNSILVADFLWCISVWLIWAGQFIGLFLINALTLKHPDIDHSVKVALLLLSIFVLLPGTLFWLVYIYWQESQVRFRNRLNLNKCLRACCCSSYFFTFRSYQQGKDDFSWLITCNSFQKQYRSFRWCGIIMFSVGNIVTYNFIYYDLLYIKDIDIEESRF
jgi:hypothetical protein